MKQYHVTGMSCAACAARVEKAVNGVEGVTSCAVSLLTNSMGVEGDAKEEDIIRAVTGAGYGASPKGTDAEKEKHALPRTDEREEAPIVRRLIVSAVFLVLLMYVSMGHGMLGLPFPFETPAAVALTELLLSAAVLVTDRHFFVSGVKGLLHGAPNMDTLVSMGSAVSFGYSTVLLYGMLLYPDRAESYLHGMYFDSAAMILTLITVGKLLEARAKGKTTDALRELAKLAPATAHLLRDGKETTVPVDRVRPGDLFAVYAGESVPVDGTVVEGESAVNESALTGESIPADKKPGDVLYAGTVGMTGYLKCRADRVGEDTTLAQIIRTVTDASATKAPISRIADRVSGIFVPTVIGIAAVTAVIWLAVGQEIGFALARGISVLVISCPCALGLATPVAIMVGSGVGAKRGILFKTAASLEAAGRAKTVIFDKTGTVTRGVPEVTEVIPAEEGKKEEFLRFASAIEKKSTHPLALAVVRYTEAAGMSVPEAQDVTVLPGAGVEGTVLGRNVRAGKGLLSSVIPAKLSEKAERLSGEGKTPLFFEADGVCLGLIAVRDGIREDSRAAVSILKDLGIRTVMLTGDNEVTAKAVAAEVGIGEVIAGVLPDGKADAVRRFRENGTVVMVGDGINDAPALETADVGIAVGAGSDIAVESAQVVLMKDGLGGVPTAIALSKATLKNIRENLFWAFFYNVIGIPLAAGVLIPVLGWEPDPMFGAAAMSLSSFFVVSNALRLNLFRAPGEESKTRINRKKKEKKPMKKTMKIEGMMCPHCEARVKKALEALEEVELAEVSHEAGTAVLTLNAEISDEKLKKTVEDQGYQVL